jgi:hypothetical protein
MEIAHLRGLLVDSTSFKEGSKRSTKAGGEFDWGGTSAKK